MGISGIGSNCQPGSVKPDQGGGRGTDAKIQALERELRTLNTEKQKAVRNKDEETERKLEKRIQEIERQIQQLRQKEGDRQEENVSENPGVQETIEGNQETGRYVDEFA